MSRLVGWGLYLFGVILLTALTQVGGAILIFSTLVVWSIFPSGRLGWFKAFVAHGLAFALLYGAICLLLIPPVAKVNGRVALQCFATEEHAIEALSPLTCLFNRNYAVAAAGLALQIMADEVGDTQPGTVIAYLDAGFPLFDGFPALPHSDHTDGRDLDLAYFYVGPSGHYVAGAARSPIGYFGVEEPVPEAPRPCADAGGTSMLRWRLDWLQPWLAPYRLDEDRTTELLTWLVLEGPKHGVTGIVIEPHMSQRLGVHSQLIRSPGCDAARHDDHVHVDFE